MGNSLGIYIHIPFCTSKCDYCNFASGVYPDSLVPPYLQALQSEMSGVHNIFRELGTPDDRLQNYQVDTIYFGGGTPSLIDARHVDQLLRLVKEVFCVAQSPEVTLEVNPGTVDEGKVSQHLAAGVNRVSIGMQTFQDSQLSRIGRSHTVSDSLATFAAYRRAGISNISVDLIAGLPGQTNDEWQQNLNWIEKLAPEHVSMYLLEIHEGTRFGTLYGSSALDVKKTAASSSLESLLPLPDEDEVVATYEQTAAHFAKLNYRQYEISNFASPGKESRHNLKYWTDQSFLGFGCGAYSYFAQKRWGNERSITRYLELMGERKNAIVYRHDLTPAELREEAIFLGLRLSDGIQLSQFARTHGVDLQQTFGLQIDHLRDAGLIEATQDYLRLTPQGRLLSNEVFGEFLRST